MTNILKPWATDNRYGPGNSGVHAPAEAPAAYSARWIDQGDYTPADILPDRQGFAYNDLADRNRLIDLLVEHKPAADLVGIERDVPVPLHAIGWWCWVRRAGGYVYVDAWLVPESDDVEDDDMPAVPADWPVQPLRAGDPFTATTATCGTCGRSWDDGVSTSMTPAPSGRCPFETFHAEVEVDQVNLSIDCWDVTADQVGDDLVLTIDTGDDNEGEGMFVLRLAYVGGDTAIPAVVRDAIARKRVFTSEGLGR